MAESRGGCERGSERAKGVVIGEEDSWGSCDHVVGEYIGNSREL